MKASADYPPYILHIIPAKAGIQFLAKKYSNAFVYDCAKWIPVFTGMKTDVGF
jgi:hypothetical protein